MLEPCGECGEPTVYATKGVDGPNRLYHANTGRAFCYRAVVDIETARRCTPAEAQHWAAEKAKLTT